MIIKNIKIKAIIKFIIVCVSILVMGMSFGAETSTKIEASNKVSTLKIHYNRPDNNYTNWDVFIWTESGTGPGGPHQFRNDEHGVVSEIDVSQGSAIEYGLIVRKSDWSEKDPGPDMLFDLEDHDGFGNMNIYVKSGDSNIYLNPEHTIVYKRRGKIQLRTATFTTRNEIKARGDFAAISSSGNVKVELRDDKNTIIQTNVIGKTNDEIIVKLTSDSVNVKTKYTLTISDTSTGISASTNVRFYKYFDTEDFAVNYTTNESLGVQFLSSKTTFKLWTPTATKVEVNIYDSPSSKNPKKYALSEKSKGLWVYGHSTSLEGKYYTYSVTNYGVVSEVVDPYAVSASTNGNRGLIANVSKLFATQNTRDTYVKLENQNDAVIYESHVRDLTMSSTTNHPASLKGKYLGVSKSGTKSPSGKATGIDHVVDLGATHLHLLPLNDFDSNDEADTSNTQFNWGYDPKNYNAPDGSYSSNAADGYVRMKELRQMVEELHKKKVGLVMDVVFNHTYSTEHAFQKIVPDYYYRITEDGLFANGTFVGNETASERTMMMKFMVDSVTFWAREYKIDGFRFDLMGIHDIDTMNQIAKELRILNKDALIYGEGWEMGQLPANMRASKQNVSKLNNIAVFNDDFRNGVKGADSDGGKPGFVQREMQAFNTLQYGFSATTHTDVYGNRQGYATNTNQIVNYVSSHDNFTLYDKLKKTSPVTSTQEISTLVNMSNTFVLTSPGISFIGAGDEMQRTKQGNDNSYNAPDSINAINYNLLDKNSKNVQYEKALIKLRKSHETFRLNTTDEIQNNIDHILPKGIQNSYYARDQFTFTINGNTTNDSYEYVFVSFNNSPTAKAYSLPKTGKWTQIGNNYTVNENGIQSMDTNTITIPAYSTAIWKLDKVATTPKYSVTFNQTVNGGEGTDTSVEVEQNTLVAKPEDSVKQNHDFIGWYSEQENGEIWDFSNNKIEKDITLYAQFKERTQATSPNINYQTHVQDIGWQNYVSNGEMSGTTAKSLRLEGIRVNVSDLATSGGIKYQTHVQDIGWQPFVNSNELSGTTGKSLRLEGIKIQFTDQLANDYDVYYRTHVQDTGWMNWVKNGELSGTTGKSLRLEGIKIVLVKKGEQAPK